MNHENKRIRYLSPFLKRLIYLTPFLLVSLIVVITFIVNFSIINMSEAPPGADYGNYLTQVNILRGDDLRGYGLRHQPLFFVFLDFILRLFNSFGQTDFTALKVAAAFVFSIIAVPFFLLAKKLSGNNYAAVISTGLFVFFISNSEMITWGGNPNTLGFCFLFLALYFLIDVISKPSKKSILLSGFFLSLVIGTHILVAIFSFGSLFLFAVLHTIFVGKRRERIKGNFKNVFYLILAAAVFSLPYISFYLNFFKNSSSELSGLRLLDFLSMQLPSLSLFGTWEPVSYFIVLISIGIAGTFWLTKYYIRENKSNGLLLFSLFITIILLALATAQPLRWLYFLPLPFLLCFGIYLKDLFPDVRKVKKATILLCTSLFVVIVILTSTYFGIKREIDAGNFYLFIDKDEIAALDWIRNSTLKNATFATSGSAKNVGGGGNSYGWWVEGYSNRTCAFTGDPEYFSFQFERDEINTTNRIFLGNYIFDNHNVSVANSFPAGIDSPLISAFIDGKYEKVLKINDEQNQIIYSPNGDEQTTSIAPFYAANGIAYIQNNGTFANMTVKYQQSQFDLTRSVVLSNNVLNNNESFIDVFYQISPVNSTLNTFNIKLWGLLGTSVQDCTIDNNATVTLYNSTVPLTQGESKDRLRTVIDVLETNGKMGRAQVLFTDPQFSVPEVNYYIEPLQNNLFVHIRITVDLPDEKSESGAHPEDLVIHDYNSYELLKELKVDYIIVSAYRKDELQRFLLDSSHFKVAFRYNTVYIFEVLN
jgi:hypothetical protein